MLLLTYVFFTISIILFLGMAYHLIVANRPGIFPTRIMLRQRAGILAVGASVFLLLALFASLFI